MLNIITDIELNGHHARYLHIKNPGKSAMLVLPGNLQEIESMTAFYKWLSPDYNYFVLEPPGTGMTEPLHPSYTLEYVADCIHQFVHEYVQSEIQLVACSYAAPVSLEYAKKYLSTITQLVLVGGMAEIPASALQVSLEVMADSLKSRTAFADGFIGVLSTDDPRIPRRKAVVKAAKRKAKGYTENQLMCFVYNSLRLLSHRSLGLESITCPAFAFTGALDPYVTPSDCERMANSLPNCEFDLIPDTDHLFLIEKPDYSGRLILDYLQGERKQVAA